jgi:hypothetical protein
MKFVFKFGKKGVLFTISAIILLTVVFSAIIFQSRYSYGESDKLIDAKTSSMNEFVVGLKEDLGRWLYIAAYGAVIGLEDQISNSHAFINDSKTILSEEIINGSISGSPVSIMNQRTVTEWLSRIRIEASKIGLELNSSVGAITVNQSNPWFIDFSVGIDFNVTDFSGTAAFYRHENITTRLSLIGFEDPIYTVFTNGLVIRLINSTPYESSYASGQDTSNLRNHINGFFYTNSTGPSFLMRLEGNLSNSTSGIESIVSLPELQGQGLPVYERCSVDYVYFSNNTPTIFKVNQTFEDWFRLDETHLNRYQVYDLKT